MKTYLKILKKNKYFPNIKIDRERYFKFSLENVMNKITNLCFQTFYLNSNSYVNYSVYILLGKWKWFL